MHNRQWLTDWKRAMIDLNNTAFSKMDGIDPADAATLLDGLPLSGERISYAFKGSPTG